MIDWNCPFGPESPASPSHLEGQAAEPPPAASLDDDKQEENGTNGGSAKSSAAAASLDFSTWVRTKAADGRLGWQAPDTPALAWWKWGSFESLATDWKGAIRQALRRGRKR